MQSTPVSNQPRYKRLNGIRGENFEIHLEYGGGLVAIHLPVVDKFDRSTFIEMKFMLEDWDEFFKASGYSETHIAFEPDNTKLARLVVRLGFEYLEYHEGLSIYRYIGE